MQRTHNTAASRSDTDTPDPQSGPADRDVESALRALGLAPHELVRRCADDPAFAADNDVAWLVEELTSRATVCSFCGVGCSYTVVEAERGDVVLPMSELGLCIKGATSLISGGDQRRARRLARLGLTDDRIRAPMIRGHDGRMVEVSWERALDRAAWLFLHTREWVGPEAVAIYGNGQKTVEAIWMACLYKLVFQIATTGANSEHCLASAGAAHELNFGNEAAFTWKEFDELATCDVCVLHGTNPHVTFPQAHEKLKRNPNAIAVVIDPIETDTVTDLVRVDPRTLHIRFAQGGDVMFNLAVTRTVFDNGWEHAAFLRRAVDPASLAALRALCGQDRCTPEAVARAIALDGQDPDELAATIRRYAALIAAPCPSTGHRPRVAFVSSMGINQSTGAYGFSTNLNLLLVTGNVGRRGAGSLRIAGQCNATSELMLGLNSRRLVFNLDPGDPAHRAELARLLDIPEGNIPDAEGTPVAGMADDDYLYCNIFVGTQMTRNMPRLGHWMRRLGRSFNIVIDSFLADGVLEFADVILPALTFTERTGVIQRGDRTLQLQQPVTVPPPLAWSDTQIMVRLALAIANRLRDPDTAALNDLDPDVIARVFGRYVDTDGAVDPAGVFDHVVAASRALDVYNRLEDADGRPITHAMLRASAGVGVQWQGDARYADAAATGAVFPRLRRGELGLARMVCPPDSFLDRLGARGDADAPRSLISGRGRPGRAPKYYRGRYNSGVKTRPISRREDDDYWLELHPDYAARRGLRGGDPIRVTSRHGAAFARVSLNSRVPAELPYLDFVPGEANRLTDYLDADQFTNQSLIKRTPVRIEPLTAREAALWERPDRDALVGAIDWLYARRDEPSPDAPDPERERVVGALAGFLQRYMNHADYRRDAAPVLRGLGPEARDRFLTVILPLLRELDYDAALLTLLTDIVGPLPMRDADGRTVATNLKAAHQSAVMEIKEEVVAVQLFMAIKRGLELLYGPGVPIPRDDVALITGIAIPCAGDVPAYVMGIAPSELEASRLIHCRAIGSHALVVVDRRRNRAVKIDVTTGVLPKDAELRRLRAVVITKKRAATRAQHRRFFERLAELITEFVRAGDDNFRVVGPVALPWDEYRAKLAFVPSRRQDFRDYLVGAQLSPALLDALIALEVLDPVHEAGVIERIRDTPDGAGRDGRLAELLADPALPTGDKVREVIASFIAPVLANDGGRIDLVDYDDDTGEVTVRFVGSCANCPCSMLSLETLVAPPLMNVPGVTRVTHRGRLRPGERPALPTHRAGHERASPRRRSLAVLGSLPR